MNTKRISKKIEDILNKQVTKEADAAQVYFNRSKKKPFGPEPIITALLVLNIDL